MPTKRVSIHDFTFTFIRKDLYLVCYTSPTTGRKWHKDITDMRLITDTCYHYRTLGKNPAQKDLQLLKRLVKSGANNL